MNTRTCLKCEGSGDKDGKGICGACGGRGYVPCADQPLAPTVTPEAETLRTGPEILRQGNDELSEKYRTACVLVSEQNSELTTLRQSVAQLTSERDEALQEAQEQARLLGMGGSREAALLSRLTAAESALVEASKDRERLDWLEKRPLADYKRIGKAMIIHNGFSADSCQHLRSAIDASRQSSSTHQQGEGL